ncbi:hypothetical protein Tco_1504934 [Tanacetum coccineum]
MDNPNITMEEYIRLEEEKARRRGKVYYLGYTAIVCLNDTLTSEAVLSCEPTVSFLNNDEIDFRISFDESDNEDYIILFDKNSFSYKMIFVNDLKTDSENDYEKLMPLIASPEPTVSSFSYKIVYVNNLKTDSENNNDKVNMPFLPSPEPTVSYFDDLDYFKDFENEFPAIVYNDALTSKSDFSTESVVIPQHIDEFNLKDETSLYECDEKEQNILYFNDLFPFNVIYPDDSKSDKDNDDDKIDFKQSLGGINTAYPGEWIRRIDFLYRPRERKSTNVGGEFTNLEILKCWSLETSRRLFNTQSCS